MVSTIYFFYFTQQKPLKKKIFVCVPPYSKTHNILFFVNQAEGLFLLDNLFLSVPILGT